MSCHINHYATPSKKRFINNFYIGPKKTCSHEENGRSFVLPFSFESINCKRVSIACKAPKTVVADKTTLEEVTSIV